VTNRWFVGSSSWSFVGRRVGPTFLVGFVQHVGTVNHTTRVFERDVFEVVGRRTRHNGRVFGFIQIPITNAFIGPCCDEVRVPFDCG